MKDAVESVLRRTYKDGILIAYEAEISVDCMTSLTTVVQQLRGLNSDVIRMLDSWGRPPAGFTTGSMAHMGDYDLCLSTTVKAYHGRRFRGQYCSIGLLPPLPPRPKIITNDMEVFNRSIFTKNTAIHETMDIAWAFYNDKLRYGICVPDLCSVDDMRKLVHTVGREHDADLELLKCEVEEPLQFDTAMIVGASILGLFVGLVLVGTTLSVVLHYLRLYKIYEVKPGVVTRHLMSLSLLKTTATLFNTGNGKQQKEHLKFFNGLRILGLFWVITFHVHVYPNMNTLKSLRTYQKSAELLLFQFVNSPGLAVDTFFFMSGFLVLFNQRKAAKTVPVVQHCFFSLMQRYWRLVPLALLVMLGVFVMPALGSGPIWKENIERVANNCWQRWWSIPAVFHNHYHLKDSCLIHFWYITADLQIYVIALALSVLAFRKPRVAKVIMISTVVASMVGIGVETYIFNYHPKFLPFTRDTVFSLEIFRWVYVLPSTHIGPYIMGSLTSLAFVHLSKKSIHMGMQLFLWTVATLLCGAALFLPAQWGSGSMPSLGVSVAYAATHRTAWSLGLCWFVFACATGRGGVLNSFLSWNAFVPLGRLSYAIYLVHAYLVYLEVWTIRDMIDTNHYNMMSSVISTFFLSVASAYLIHIFLERPINLFWDLLSPVLKKRLRLSRPELKPSQIEDQPVKLLIVGNFSLPRIHRTCLIPDQFTC